MVLLGFSRNPWDPQGGDPGTPGKPNWTTIVVLLTLEILEMSRGRNGQMLNCQFVFLWLQFQGLGKYKTIYIFVTQNVFGNNRRKKLADSFFVVFIKGLCNAAAIASAAP